jgi:hypothetical protein
MVKLDYQQHLIILKYKNMANKFYEIIDNPIKEIGEKVYQVQTFNLNLKDFLKTYFDKELYIYGPSIETNQIRAIII